MHVVKHPCTECDVSVHTYLRTYLQISCCHGGETSGNLRYFYQNVLSNGREQERRGRGGRRKKKVLLRNGRKRIELLQPRRHKTDVGEREREREDQFPVHDIISLSDNA